MFYTLIKHGFLGTLSIDDEVVYITNNLICCMT